MTEYTPGPWEAVPLNPNDPSAHLIVTPEGVIATAVGATEARYQPLAAANARLLAAAPELLETLQLVAGELEQLHRHHYPTCDGGCPADVYLTQARALIAKTIAE